MHGFSANYSELAGEGAPDLVTLIGVLEYSHLYHPVHRDEPEAAAVANLRVARSALAEDGVLVLAIENRLGLKYLNAAREGHSGRLFEGIEGYVHPGTPVTWSARALETMLAAAGFGATRFLLPFPAYKLARTIVNVEACRDEDAVHAWLAGPAPGRGTARPDLLFNETLAVREVARAGLLRDLANSFLVLAYAGDPGRTDARLCIDLGWAVRHYSLDRRAGLRKRATLRGDVVEHEPAPFGDAGRSDVRDAAAAGLVHSPATEPHHRGELLSTHVLESSSATASATRSRRTSASTAPGCSTSTPSPARVSWSRARRSTPAGGTSCSTPAPGARRVIDTEWALVHPVPVDFVVWRTVYHFLLRHHPELPRPVREQPVGALLAAALGLAGVHLADEAVRSYVALETAFAAAVSPGPVPDALLRALLSASSLHALPRGDDRRRLRRGRRASGPPAGLCRLRVGGRPDDARRLRAGRRPGGGRAGGGRGPGRGRPGRGRARRAPARRGARPRGRGPPRCRRRRRPHGPRAGRPFGSVPRLDAAAADILREAAERLAVPAGPALPEPVAAVAREVAGRHGHGRLVAVAAGPPAGGDRRGWRTCDPRSVSPDTLMGDLAGTVAVCVVDARRLQSDHCLRTVLQVAADCADALVVAVRDGRLRQALRVLEVDASSEVAVDGHAVAVVHR